MMAKLRITLVAVYEYEAKPNGYPKNKRTPEDMLAVDIELVERNGNIILADGEVKITGEIIER